MCGQPVSNPPQRLRLLIWLADQEWHAQHGRPYTEATYCRWNNGPFSREFWDAVRWMDGIELISCTRADDSSFLIQGPRSRLAWVQLDLAWLEVVDRICLEWLTVPFIQLWDHVYADPVIRDSDFGDPLLV